MAAIHSTDVLALLGTTVDLVEAVPMPCGPESRRYRARVMAVQMPAPGTGIECSLLLLEEGLPPDCMDYVELDRLQLA